MNDADRRWCRIFGAVDSMVALYLLAVFFGAVAFNVLPVDPMDFQFVELTRVETVAKTIVLYTLVPLSAALIALVALIALRRGPRPVAAAAFAVMGFGLLFGCCVALVPWGRDQGWTPYLLGLGLIFGGMAAHGVLAVRLWRRTLAPAG